METLRKSYVTLPLANMAVAQAVATFVATHRARVSFAQLTLADTGAGSGATTVLVKVNGSAIVGSSDLSIAGAAAVKYDSQQITLGSNNFPGGALINPGDVITVDITAIPATAPKSGSVILDLTQQDV